VACLGKSTLNREDAKKYQEHEETL